MDKYLILDSALNEILTPVPMAITTSFTEEFKAEYHRIAAGEGNP